MGKCEKGAPEDVEKSHVFSAAVALLHPLHPILFTSTDREGEGKKETHNRRINFV